MTEEKITKKDVKEIIDGAIGEFAKVVSDGFHGVDKQFKEVRTEMQEMKTELRGEMQEMGENIKRELLDSNDKIATELKKVREEQIASVGSRDRLNEKLDNHEDRIVKLENTTKIENVVTA